MGAALETPSVPQVVGRYVLYGAIASGGMATVHFGRLVGAAGFARAVAIKRLHPQFARDPEFVRMFLDEARLAARVTHPNVVQTIDLVEATNEVFLVMEYVRGMALSALVRLLRHKGERVPTAVALGIVVGVLEGLHAAHEAKDDMGERLDLVHRDVSPQNVLVGTDGIARLIDFGVAKAAGRSQATRDGQLKGKIAYMAPEQAQGQAVTRRTDIYAASVMLWEVLTGQRLFHGESDVDSLRRVLSAEVTRPSAVVAELPPGLDRVVLKGLERDAGRRYATAHDMALELGECMAAAPAAEIGGWVERAAAPELSERASLIAAIERSAAESMSRLTAVAALPGAGAPDMPTPVGNRIMDATTDVHTLATRMARVGVGAGAYEVSSFQLRMRNRRWTLVAAVGSTVVATCVVFGALLAPSRAPLSPRAAAVASVDAPVAAVYAERTTPPAESTSALSAAVPPTRVVRPVPARAAPAVKPGCDPPYTVDAQGHLHFKASCM